MPLKFLSHANWPFIFLIILFIMLYAWRMSGILWLPAISGHLSNFALTGSAMLLLIGPRSFRQKTGRMKVIIVTLIFIMANLVVEGMAGGTLNGFNVLDTYDALFGVAACGIIVAVHVYMTRR